MISREVKNSYSVTIGIECHVQLKTKTKLFAAVGNDARSAEPNSLISHICLGMPGALPVLNEAAVKLASVAAYALGTAPQPFSKFDRKHYFYPDLPKGYQITQFDEPVILGGYIDIIVDDKPKRINLTRAHLEEDAGKSTHPSGKDYSLVDFNRAGTPLLEIVSEPEMHSAVEARAYAHELWLLMRYAQVSEANLYYGNMRFDINVSVSQTDEMGTRTETKNLNSFKSIEKAVEYEVNRQIEVLETGSQIVQETRGWDDAKQKTFSQRTKEDAHDYRYFPDPDIPPVVINEDMMATAQSALPVMPNELRAKFSALELGTAQIETLLDNRDLAMILNEVGDTAGAKVARYVANWLTGELLRLIADGEYDFNSQYKLDVADWIALANLTSGGSVSSTGAKKLLSILLTEAPLNQLAVDKKDSALLELAKSSGVLQNSDNTEIEKIVAEVLAANPKAADDVRAGEMKAIGFLTGQVMKFSQGKANPGMAQAIIKRQLGT